MDVSKLDKYRNKIKEVTRGDDYVVDMVLFETGRGSDLSTIARHPFLFHGLLCTITNVLYPLMGLKRRVKLTQEDDFAFVSCPDPIFRTKTIGLIAGDLKYGIIYLPTFHITAALTYHKFFYGQHTKAYFPTIKLRHVLDAKRNVKSFKKQCTDLGNDIESQRLLSTLSIFLIYDGVVKDYFKTVEGFKGKWILEHQIYYFFPVLASLHMKGKITTMLQHGIFFKPSYNYIPMFCDKVLCCSEREREIYIKNGVRENRVTVFGAPLQTLQQGGEKRIKGKQYDLLVLVTYINNENIEFIKIVLNFIRQNYVNTLVRLRPRSRTEDKTRLGEALEGFTLSKEGVPLIDDLSRCCKVVSFSEDANIEVAKSGKQFICVLSPKEINNMTEYGCATIENYQEEIKKLMEQDSYSTFSKEQYNEVLGETNVEILRERFAKYIKS